MSGNVQSGEVFYATRWRAMVGCEDDALAPTPDTWLSRVHPDDAGTVECALENLLAGRVEQYEIEYRMRHRDGTWRWMSNRGLAERDGSGRVSRIAGSQTDITERKAVQQKLLWDARHDDLTGLPNRPYFLECLELAVAQARRRPTHQFAVLFLDLDRFKVVNDSLGHQAGDHLLTAVAERLTMNLGPRDLVARLGGDEFTVLLDGIRDATDAIKVADRIQKELEAPFAIDGADVFTNVSIGIAASRSGYSRAADVLRDADTAMYRAKSGGQSRRELFDLDMHHQAVRRLELETDLRHAIDRDELQLYYQPIITLETGRLSGFEALLRWTHPNRGMVSPNEFIPLAEETGLITPIGAWVLREACEQVARWQRRFPSHRGMCATVNLSAHQLEHDGIVTHLDSVLSDTGLDPRHLRLEVTENVMMEDPVRACETLTQLKARDVALLMDDFGTGYSSLCNLRRFPFDSLKIDRSFVSGMSVLENAHIVRSIVQLARNLGMDVTAEGVETSQQHRDLRAIDCRYGQGFYFSKPLAPAAAEGFMRSYTGR